MGKLSLPIVILILLINTSCNINPTSDYEAGNSTTTVESSAGEVSPPAAVESSACISQPVTLNTENDNFLEREGTTQYFYRMEEDSCILYAMDDNESAARQLAVFPPLTSDYVDPTPNYIIDFGIFGDWIIASVGHYEGSGHYFFGDFVRLKKDGSELEHFWLTDNDTFVVVGEWIYYNFWTVEDHPENVYGCYRIKPDGTDKEYMGDKLYSIILYDEQDGYIYGEYDTGKKIPFYYDDYFSKTYSYAITDFIRCKPDGSGTVILFSGKNLPEFSESDLMGYYDVAVKADFVTFTVFVHGYSEGDSWRGHTMYEADYRVNKDGSHLILLSESYAGE